MNLTLEEVIIKDNIIFTPEGKEFGTILYRYIRGSHLYNTNIETSDIDEGGIYIANESSLLGLRLDYQPEIKDKTNDKCIWELGRFMELVVTANPTVLEALFADNDKVLYEHPIITDIKKYRNEFLYKRVFDALGGYSVSQIKKAQGQNKKIHWDMENMTKKTPLDFCYTFNRQGSIPIKDWLAARGLYQDNCGLVDIPNMPGVYGVYYDYGQHMELAGIDSYKDLLELGGDNFIWHISDIMPEPYWDFESDSISWFNKNRKPKGGHRGIISPDENSNEIRLSSIPDKYDKPICYMTYNANGYATHCREWREYSDWKAHRNKARYESNLEGENSGDPELKYDCKNMMHCFRLMAMAKEIAEGKGFILDRTGIDRDFLLDVRNRKFKYSELQEKMLALKEQMDEAISKSTLKESPDIELINNLLLKARKKFRKEKC